MADAVAVCEVCGWDFHYRPKRPRKGAPLSPPPSICGQVACRARHDWEPDDWAGRARMATARALAGVALDELDREALARCAGAQTPHIAA